jgi:hypothetical protein
MRFDQEIAKGDISVIMTEQQKEVLNNEFNKAIDEIKENTADNKKWFYFKLVLIGSLIGAIFFLVARDLDDNIEYISIIKKRAFTITIGIAFIIAIIIDIQVKQNHIVTNQLGNWIAYQYEPVMKYCRIVENKCPNYDSIVKYTPSLHNDSLNFYLWENFLRIVKQDTFHYKNAKKNLSDTDILEEIKKEKLKVSIINNFYKKKSDRIIRLNKKNGSESIITNLDIELYLKNNYKVSESQHTDILYSVFHFPAFHMFSWILYAVFICSFYFK